MLGDGLYDYVTSVLLSYGGIDSVAKSICRHILFNPICGCSVSQCRLDVLVGHIHIGVACKGFGDTSHDEKAGLVGDRLQPPRDGAAQCIGVSWAFDLLEYVPDTVKSLLAANSPSHRERHRIQTIPDGAAL